MADSDYATNCHDGETGEVLSVRWAYIKAAKGTTMHGVANIYAGSRIRRFFWLICVIGGLCGAVAFSSSILSDYVSFRKNTNVVTVSQTEMKLGRRRP